jgi:hypothetical protein
VNHAERVDQAAIEEDPLGRARTIQVLLDISTQDLASEGDRVRSRTLAVRKAFGDYRARRFIDRCVSFRGELGEERCLTSARSASNDHSVKTVSLRN